MIPLLAALLSALLVARRERLHLVVALPLGASLVYLTVPFEGRAALLAILAGSAATCLAYALAWGARRDVVVVAAGSASVGLVVGLAPLSHVGWIAASWGPLAASVVVGAALVLARPVPRTITSAVLVGILTLDASALLWIARAAAVLPQLAELEAGLVAVLQVGWFIVGRGAAQRAGGRSPPQ